MPDETVLDAVNAALGDQIAPEAETPEEEIPEGETPEATTEEEVPEGETPKEEETPEEKPEAERGPNGERERNPDGTWKKAEEPKKEEPKKADPVNDPILKGLKKDTQERIRTLIDTTKAVTVERDTIKRDFDYMVQGVQATGATPEQYGETLSWLALFNSNDPKSQEKALELVENVAERLATLLGKERTVGDPLAAHADLKDAVAKGQVTAQYAKEIARTRNGQTFRQELTTQATTQQQQQAQAAQELTAARNDLSTLEVTLKASDPQYEAKKAILVPALKPVFAVIPPSQWKDKFMEAYRNIKVNTPVAQPKGAPANQPLRAKQPAGGQTKAPSSMREAIDGALGGMK